MLRILSTILFISTIVSTFEKRITTKPSRFVGDFLIGISSVSSGFERRALMREAQIENYKEGNFSVTWRFMVLRPNNETIREQIMQENKTHGDIIILEKYEDSKKNAIWIKPFEFFKYVEANMPKYRYVAKMDDDTYMNITGLYTHLFSERVRRSNKTIIAAWHIWNSEKVEFPHGGFYALSWDLMLKLNYLYDTEPLTFEDKLEDFQVAIFFKNASVPYKKVQIYPLGCNWKTHDRPTPMSRCNLTYEHMNEFANIIRVHLLKDEPIYRNISSYFIKHERELRARKPEVQCNENTRQPMNWDAMEYNAGPIPSKRVHTEIPVMQKKALDEL